MEGRDKQRLLDIVPIATLPGQNIQVEAMLNFEVQKNFRGPALVD